MTIITDSHEDKPIKEQGYSNGEVHVGGHC